MGIGGPGESFSELRRSRLGHTSGVSSASANTQWLVTTDDIDDNPVLALATNKVPSGHPHPWEPLAKATDYTVSDRLSHKKWIVTVTYKTLEGVGPDDRQGTASRWRLSIRGVSISEHIIEEVERGAGAARAPDRIVIGNESPTPVPTGGRKVIGPHLYDIVPDAPTGQPAATFTHTVTINDTKTLNLKASALRQQLGWDVEIPCYAMIFTREQPSFDFARITPLILEHYKRINSSEVFGCKARKVLFQDFSVDETAGTWNPSRAQAIQGLIYRVSLGFLCHRDEWSPVDLVEQYTDPETGGINFVKIKDGGIARGSFHVKTSSDFNTLLRVLV